MSLKQRLVNMDITFGSWITIGNTIIAEIMAKSGYDWLTIDMEHSAITIDCAQELIRVIDLCNTTPLVRVGSNDETLIKRVMDAGAKGVIVPMVNSADDAKKAVDAVKYPPVGTRGVGLARAQAYGQDFEGYRHWNQENSIVIVQIEHIRAVENIEDIMNVNGVDGFIIGPYDLSGSMGIPGDFDHPDMVSVLKKVQEYSRINRILSGYHVISTEKSFVDEKINEGYKFIAHSLDMLFLGDKIKETLPVNRK